MKKIVSIIAALCVAGSAFAQQALWGGANTESPVVNEDGTVTYQEVVLGRRMGTEYEVLEGLQDGATVVTGGQIRLKNGVKVEVK